MKLISYRGNDNHKYKENTKEAILSSINQNYIDGVEFDIRLTKDNYFVIYHNLLIEYNNILVPIKSLLLKEIKDVYKKISSLEDVCVLLVALLTGSLLVGPFLSPPQAQSDNPIASAKERANAFLNFFTAYFQGLFIGFHSHLIQTQ